MPSQKPALHLQETDCLVDGWTTDGQIDGWVVDKQKKPRRINDKEKKMKHTSSLLIRPLSYASLQFSQEGRSILRDSSEASGLTLNQFLKLEPSSPSLCIKPLGTPRRKAKDGCFSNSAQVYPQAYLLLVC